MTPFVFSGQLPRVVLGAGSLRHLLREIDLLGPDRARSLAYAPGKRCILPRAADTSANSQASQ